MIEFSEKLEIFEAVDYDRSPIEVEFWRLNVTGKQLVMLEIDMYKLNEMKVHPKSKSNTRFHQIGKNTNFFLPRSPNLRRIRRAPIKSEINRKQVTMRNEATKPVCSLAPQSCEAKDVAKEKGKSFFKKRIFSLSTKTFLN